MIPIVAIIPTRFDIPSLPALINNIIEDVKDIYILDNGLDGLRRAELYRFPKVTILPCDDKSIYQMWNFGMDTIIKTCGKESYSAVLNDDIFLLPNTLKTMAGFLDSYSNLVAVSPDYNRKLVDGFGKLELEFCESTFGHGGMAGFAFMIKNKCGIRVDETFKWWYGDDDLVKQILKTGNRVGKIINLPLEHNQGSSFVYRKSELNQYIVSDRFYFNQKYGENRWY
jgi:hypothetical protein